MQHRNAAGVHAVERVSDGTLTHRLSTLRKHLRRIINANLKLVRTWGALAGVFLAVYFAASLLPWRTVGFVVQAASLVVAEAVLDIWAYRLFVAERPRMVSRRYGVTRWLVLQPALLLFLWGYVTDYASFWLLVASLGWGLAVIVALRRR